MTENNHYNIGGGTYAQMRDYRVEAQEWEKRIAHACGERKDTKSRIFRTPRNRLVKNMWQNLNEIPAGNKPEAYPLLEDSGKWQWMMLNIHWNDIYQYKLTQQDYYKIAKFAAEKWARDEGHRVRADVLSPEQYYTICKIMANQGVFWGLNHDKLQKVGNLGLCNPVSDIILTALKNMHEEWRRKAVFDYMSRNKEIYFGLLKLIAEPTNHLHSH